MSLFNKKESKLSNYLDGYKKTNKSLAVKITELLGGYSANNDDIYEELLVLLISSDISVDNAEKIMDQLKERVNEQFVKNPKTISYMLADILKENYKDYQKLSIEKDKNKLIMMVGVNGSGKTTTISKLANYYIKHGFGVVLKSVIQLRFICIRGHEGHINAHLLHGNGNQVIGAAIDGR